MYVVLLILGSFTLLYCYAYLLFIKLMKVSSYKNINKKQYHTSTVHRLQITNNCNFLPDIAQDTNCGSSI